MPGRVHCLSGKHETTEHDCVITSISELGCKVTIEGAAPENFPPESFIKLEFMGDLKFIVKAKVSRMLDVVEGWGVQVGICFRSLDSVDRNHVMHLLYGNSRYVNHKSSQIYRRRRYTKTIKKVGLVCAALVLGFISAVFLKKLPEKAEQVTQQAVGAVKTAALEQLGQMSPEERQTYLKSLSPEQVEQYKTMGSSLAQEAKKKLYDNLSAEEKKLAQDYLKKNPDELNGR